MSAGDIDTLLELWAASLLEAGGTAPFTNHRHLYKMIDSAKLGDVPWQKFNMVYDGEVPSLKPPSWMTAKFQVWFRDPHIVVKDMLGNTEFDGEMDTTPYRDYDDMGRQYQNFMSGNWAWTQAVCSVLSTLC
jgi:hypothetical protein